MKKHPTKFAGYYVCEDGTVYREPTRKNENGLIRVSVDSFFTEEEAQAILTNVKKQLSSAWILNQN